MAWVSNAPRRASALLLLLATSACLAHATDLQKGFGKVTGRVLYDEKPAAGVKVVLCQEIQLLGGCRGQRYEGGTDARGEYSIDKVKPGSYSVAAAVFDTKKYVFATDGFFTAKSADVREGATTQMPPINLFKDDLKTVSPRGNAVVRSARPALQWQAYPGAAKYAVSLSGQGPANVYPGEKFETAATQVVPAAALLNGAYSWRVTAFNARGVKLADVAESSTFKVAGQEDPLPPVKLIAPLERGGPVSGAAVKFKWTAQPKATSYELKLARTYRKDAPPFSKAVTSTEPGYQWDSPLPPGEYRWHVNAMKGQTRIATSTFETFRIK